MTTGNQILLFPEDITIFYCFYFVCSCDGSCCCSSLSLCQESVAGVQLRSSRSFLRPSLSLYSHILLFPYVNLFSNVLIFSVWLPKVRERKKLSAEEKGVGPLNPLEVTSAWGMEDCYSGRRKNNSCISVIRP